MPTNENTRDRETKVFFVDATVYHRSLDKRLAPLKKEFFKIKAHARKIILGEIYPALRPRQGYSIGLLRMANFVRNLNGYEAKYCALSDAAGKLETLAPGDIVAFGAVTPTVEDCARLAQRIRERSPGVRIAIGGPHARMAPNATKALRLDGEEPAFDLVVTKSERAAVAELLDMAVDRVEDPQSYITYDQLQLPNYALNILSGSGCSFRCRYCHDSYANYLPLPQDLFQRWFKTTVNAIHNFRGRGKAYPLHFCDSELGGGSAVGAMRVCESITKAAPGHGLLLSCDLRPEQVLDDPERLLRALAEAGFRELRIGLDSSSDRVLEGLERTATRGKFYEAVARIRELERKYGQPFYLSTYVVTGLPGSRLELDQQTTRFVTELLEKGRIDEIKHHLYVPYPCDNEAFPHNSIPAGVKLASEDWLEWKNYDRQSHPVYSLDDYPASAIWDRFLAAEAEINEAWKKRWDGGEAIPDGQYAEYNVNYYLKAPDLPAASVAGSPINVAFLSDLHLANEKGDATADEKERLELAKTLNVATYSGLLDAKLLEVAKQKLDFLVVSGDITFQGLGSGFEKFKDLVNGLFAAGAIDADLRRIIVVPGNHDVADSARLKAFGDMVGDYVHPILDTDDALLKESKDGIRGKIRLHFPVNDDPLFGGKIDGQPFPFVIDIPNRVLFYAFNSAIISRSKIRMSEDITRILEKLNGTERDAVTRLFEVDPAGVGLAELNLARAILDSLAEQLDSLDPPIAIDEFYKIAVLHHPVSPISPCTEIKKFGNLLNAGELKRTLLELGFGMVLHGHYHWPEVYKDTAIAGGGGAFWVLSGGAICDTVSEMNDLGRGFFNMRLVPSTNFLETRYIELQKRLPGPWKYAELRSVATPDSRVWLQRDKRRIAKDLLYDRLRQEEQEDFGWPHNLDQRGVDTIGTAFGLMILNLGEGDSILFREKQRQIVDTLMRRRLAAGDRGWSLTKPSGTDARPGRPDATAWVLEALISSGESEGGKAAQEDLLALVEDPVGRGYVLEDPYLCSLVLRVLAASPFRPPVLSKLSQALIRMARKTDDGQYVHWRGSGSASNQPSVANTANALIALVLSERGQGAQGQAVGAIPKKAAAWLLSRQDWRPERATIPYASSLSPGREPDQMNIWHYSKAWALMACLEAGIAPSEERLSRTVAEIWADQDREQGLWDLKEGEGIKLVERPVWATYDALRALTRYYGG